MPSAIQTSAYPPPPGPEQLGHRLAALDLLAAEAPLALPAHGGADGPGRAGVGLRRWLAAGPVPAGGGVRLRLTYGRASSSFFSASSSVTLRAKVSSDTRIWRALVSMRFSPADRPLSFSRIDRFRTTSATW